MSPSGLFPSPLDRPDGSLTEGMSALARVRHTISLRLRWRLDLPELLLQERLWWPRGSTSSPHVHLWGSHNFTPNLRPTAIRTASSSNLSPHDDIGKAWSQSLLLGADTAKIRALSRVVFVKN